VCARRLQVMATAPRIRLVGCILASGVLACVVLGPPCDLVAQAAQGGIIGGDAMPNQWRTVRLVRSGGPLFRPVAATVAFQGQTAKIRYDAAGADRELTELDVEAFHHLDPSKLRSSPFTQLKPGAPDRFQYDVSIETVDGHRFDLHFHEESAEELNAVTPGLGDLAAWVRRAIQN
jgi:hypothetical protein